jgi:hypothetical protein
MASTVALTCTISPAATAASGAACSVAAAGARAPNPRAQPAIALKIALFFIVFSFISGLLIQNLTAPAQFHAQAGTKPPSVW